MERQDSVNSIGSVASALSLASSGVGGDIVQGDLADQTQTVVVAVFGALSTLFCQRWEDSKRYAAARFLLEHLQLILMMLQTQWLWSIDYSSTFWDIADVVLVKNVFITRGYSAYAGVLYALMVTIGVTVAACGWISFTFVKNGPLQNRWFIKLLRLLMMLMHQVFYVAILDLLISPLACNWSSSENHVKGYSYNFPTHACKQMPYLGTMVASAVFAVIFAAISGLFALADVTPNPVSQRWLAQADSSVEFKAWIFKTVIVLCANVLQGIHNVQSLLILIAAGWLAYTYLRWQPYYFGWVNHLRTGLYAMTAYLALMLTINVWAAGHAVEAGHTPAAEHRRAERLTHLALGLMPVAFAAAAAASFVRLKLASRTALKVFQKVDKSDATAMLDLRDLFKFVDEYEVEIISRCCRRWTDFEDKELDPSGADLAEVVIKAGLACFNHSSHMILVWVHFLENVLQHKGSCGSQLLAAKKLNPNWCDRYALFVHEQQQMSLQKGENTSTGGVDLAGYLEFQRAYKMVLRAHKAALHAQQAFWRVMTHTSVTSEEIVCAMVQLENSKSKADRTYQTVLERYPTNVKVLRAVGRFVDDLKHDPWAAAKYYADANKYDAQEAYSARESELLAEDIADGKPSAMMAQVDERNSAVCVINAHGIIQMANKRLLKMFGYQHGQLEGKNVSLLMPQPFSGRHNGYLRNYQTTGKAKILDTLREVVGLHSEHYVFPLHLMVTKISGTGPDAIFMGVLKPAAKDTECIRTWMTVEGFVLCVDGLFGDWLGKSPGECLGKPFTSLAVDPQQLQGLLDRAQVADEEEFHAGGVCLGNVLLEHKFAGSLRVHITIELGGTSSQRLLVAMIRKHAAKENDHVMVTDHRGRIMYATNKLATFLGFPDSKSIVKTEFANYLAQPYRQLHGGWLKDVPAKIALNSCRNKVPVTMVTQQNTVEPVLLDISSKEQGENNIYIVKVEPITYPQAVLHRRMSLTIDKFGNVLQAQDSPATLFGFSPQAAVGRNISHCIDVLVGLPETDGPDGRDMVNVLSAMVRRVAHDHGYSWRCGVHPPMTAEEVAAAKSNAMHANMLANQTKPAILDLDFKEADDDFGGVASITVHLWRADMMTGVVEVDRDGVIVKAGCCDLHMAGPLLGVDSECMLLTPLSKWVDVPEGYRGLMMDQKKKGGLRQQLADIKVGPLRHAAGNHADGELVHATVQAVVKEGTSGPPRLVVKMSISKPRKGDPRFVKQLLEQAKELQQEEELAADDKVAAQLLSVPKLGSAASFGAFRGAYRLSSRRNGWNFTSDGGGSSVVAQKPPAGPADVGRSSKMQPTKANNLLLKKAADVPPGAHDDMANGTMSRRLASAPDIEDIEATATDEASDREDAGMDKASQHSGDENLQADFERGKRMRRLARVMNTRLAAKTSASFQKQAVMLIIGLMLAHVVCFVVSLVTINSQAQYMKEVDDAGDGVMAMHKIAIECRALDAISADVEHQDIFRKADVPFHMDRLQVLDPGTEDVHDMESAREKERPLARVQPEAHDVSQALDDFQFGHQMTYFGSSKMRRLENRPRYKLRDFFEADMWNSTEMIETEPPSYMARITGLWEIGNEVLNAGREIHFKYANHTAAGRELKASRFWYYVVANAPGSLYDGYMNVLYGLVDRALEKISSIRSTLTILLVLEGCVLAMATALYMAYLTNKMEYMRANLFSMFLVVPNGLLRALATRKVRLDKEAESDDESEAGDVQQEQEQPHTSKTDLSSLKSGRKPKGQEQLALVATGGGSKRKGHPPGTVLGRLSGVFNPMSLFGSRNRHTIDTGRKQLVRSSRRTLLVTLPFLLWCGILVMIYGVSLMQIAKVTTPFQMLNMVNFLVFRTFRVVLVALEMSLTGDASAIDILKQRTNECLQELEHDYISFLYGFKALGAGAVRNDLSNDAAGIFQDSQLADIFFRHRGCLREDPSTCFGPGHKYHAITHHGLDTMASRFVEETRLLLADLPGDIHVNSTRFEYIWQVGQEDLASGIRSADHTFRAMVEDMFNVLTTAHVLVFVFSLLGGLLTWLLVLRPYLRRTGKEIGQIAEMLSQLPLQMDVEALVKQALTTGEDDVAAAGAPAVQQPSQVSAAATGTDGLMGGGPGRLTAPPGKAGTGKKGYYDASNNGAYNGGPMAAGKYGGNYYSSAEEDY